MSRILVVDDSRDVSEVIAMGLRVNGHEVALAHNGAKALALLQESQPDLILLDLMMPDMTGHEVAAAIREMPSAAHVPIIFVSARDEPEERAASLALPQVVDYVCKPFVFAELLIRVTNALQCHAPDSEAKPETQDSPSAAASLSL